MNHIDPNITTLCTHAGATDAPDITIDPMLDRGSTLAAPQTANTTNGYELLLNGWYEIGDTRPITPWLSIAMDTSANTHYAIAIQYIWRGGDIEGLGCEGALTLPWQIFHIIS